MEYGKTELLRSKIYTVRDLKVMVDEDLAELYGTETKYINRAIDRNAERFPSNFCFQLTEIEWNSLRFQFGTSKTEGRGGRRYLPFVFTEYGVVMLATVLKSSTAIQASIQIVNTYIELRKMVVDYNILERRISKLELKFDKNSAYVLEAIKELLRITPGLDPTRKKIGLTSDKKNKDT